jgi:hypothetical protein
VLVGVFQNFSYSSRFESTNTHSSQGRVQKNIFLLLFYSKRLLAPRAQPPEGDIDVSNFATFRKLADIIFVAVESRWRI